MQTPNPTRADLVRDAEGADDAGGPDLARRLGYVLKQAQSALRSRMDGALRPLGLTVPQYACLELLASGPLTNAELARGVFVTAQSMNSVVKSLQERGLVAREDVAPTGRRRPAELTAPGRALLAEADGSVRRIEAQMIDAIAGRDADRLVDDLSAIAEHLPSADRG
ncbi:MULTISPECIES: MarR family winged helix-turn-helix transcriptional regulator [unclassified Brachybacterium]|uniref:MarR family winged helix-turn-helix transcriptional regulator n=1 Tax=unclassified Brachybacterium TaxID=2623841 RepID=UPI0040334109